ncbi:MAG TPA: choloylglycine hydrolase [Bacteroidales bacterium]|nr:choloylglycine hydrolase [Bacteroidales bacterium]
MTRNFLWSILRFFMWLLVGLLFFLLGFWVYFHFATKLEEPIIDSSRFENFDRIELNDSTFVFKESFLRKNSHGIWEMYLKGNAVEIGYSHGILSKELMQFQEKAFVSQIQKMIPNPEYLKFLKYVTAWMNRDLDEYIAIEYQQEIKAVSLFADSQFSFIGNNYERQLNYHAAHDIGHAMQNLNLVACTAFSVWDSLSADSTLLIGRNFDFYVGDDFAKNKIIMFVEPDQGYQFVSIAWAGMSGVVSGMNNQGLSVTLNAAKSKIPFSAKTPVSIIAREIVQYASTIEQAYAIAKSRRSFVAESFFIGSANENQTAIIEKTPDTTILLRAEKEAKQILTNHFQSNALFFEDLNQENLNENATGLRFKRVQELMDCNIAFDPDRFVSILRNPFGRGEQSIGIGNEEAVNQYVAHHSLVLQPEKLKLWMSSPPFQLGDFISYSLKEIFNNPQILFDESRANSQMIQKDRSQLNSTYLFFSTFRNLKLEIERAVQSKQKLSQQKINDFIEANPNYFFTWELLGDYYQALDEFESAKTAFARALEMNIPNQFEREKIEGKFKNCSIEAL